VTAGGSFTLKLHTDFGFNGEKVTIDATAFQVYDLGLFTLPVGADPVYDGYTNNALAVRAVNLGFYADRTAGTNLDIDYYFACPADEELIFVDWGDHNAALRPVLDGPNETTYYEHTSGGIGASAAIIQGRGGFPKVQPNQINRYYFLDDLDANLMTTSNSITWAYMPRWLVVRP
jgi:hypothetical protein